VSAHDSAYAAQVIRAAKDMAESMTLQSGVYRDGFECGFRTLTSFPARYNYTELEWLDFTAGHAAGAAERREWDSLGRMVVA